MIDFLRNLLAPIDLCLVRRRATIGRKVKWGFPIDLVGADQLKVGDGVFIGENVKLDASGGIVIGDHTLISAGVFVTSRQHNYQSTDLRIREQGYSFAPVIIGHDVWIGHGAKILPGVSIGAGSIIGAGSVVNRDTGAYEIWAGVPARYIKSRCNQ